MTSVETWLDPNERQQLVECESVIEAGLASFVEVGVALAEVRDEHLALLPDALTAASQAASEVLALVGPATQIRRVK